MLHVCVRKFDVMGIVEKKLGTKQNLSWKMALRKELELDQQYLWWNTVGNLANKK